MSLGPRLFMLTLRCVLIINSFAAQRTGFQCDNCARRHVKCVLEPTGACQQCHISKLKCSMVPCRQSGVPNRQLLSAKTVFEFRLAKHNEASKPTAVDRKQEKKGKKPARKHQEDPEAPQSGDSGPSPSTSLLPLGRMTLESASSKGDSPVPDCAGSQLSPLFSVEVPLLRRISPHTTTQTIVVPPYRPSPSAISKSSDDGQNRTARLAALEARVDRLEQGLEEQRAEEARWRKLVNRRLKDGGL